MDDAVTGTVDIECDFFEDVRAHFVEALRSHHIALPAEDEVRPATTRAKEAAAEFFHLEHRLVQPRPRRVLWSRQLRARTLSDEHRLAVETIASELEAGVEVRPRMSKSIKQTVARTQKKDKKGRDTYDGLLTDWGIHHLHIGSAPGADGFVTRGGPLLFVFFHRDAVYLVDLLGHGTSFTDQQLLEIIHENWPDVIASWRPSGFVPGSLSSSYRPEERRMLREKFTSMTQVKDGTIYLPPGGGVVASGHSLLAVRRANALLNLVRPAEDWVRENVELIASRIEKLTWVRPTRLRLQFQTELTLAMGRAVIWETTTRAEIMPDGPEPIVGILSGAA